MSTKEASPAGQQGDKLQSGPGEYSSGHGQYHSPNAEENPRPLSAEETAQREHGNPMLTVISAANGKRLSKQYQLDESGALEKLGGGRMSRGHAQMFTLPEGLADVAALLAQLKPHQALCFGTPEKDAIHVVSRDKWLALGKPANAIPRTKENFHWPDDHAVMMFDYDPPGDGQALDRDGLLAALRDAVPGLSQAACVWFPSSSSHITNEQTNEDLTGLKGQRLYFILKHGNDIERAGKDLQTYLWAAGHGHVMISESGAKLKRTIFDASVWQTNRLDFAAGASCVAPLTQRRGEPQIMDGEVEVVDTMALIPPPPDDVRLKADRNQKAATQEADEEAFEVRHLYVEGMAHCMAGDATGDEKEYEKRLSSARSTVETALSHRTLAGDFPVTVVMGNGEKHEVTVGNILDERGTYHGLLTLDPLEAGYDGGRAVGRLYLMDAKPRLHSFAHGGKTYRLHRAPARVQLVKGHTAEAATATIDLLRRDPVAFDFGGQLALADDGRVHPLCEFALAHHLGYVTQFWKMVRQGDAIVPADCDPPGQLLKQIIAQGERRKLKPLDGVITGPTIRLDGSVLDAPGYDAATRLLFDPMGEDAPEVPMRPTLDQARDALDLLLHPFQTFPFVDANAKGALLAAILTAAVRPVLPTSPAFAFDAPIQGSGKTLLASCVGAMIEGCSPDIWPHTQGRDDEETRKRLFTALRTGCRALVWDNVTGTFDSASMAAFITADAMIDRVLGKSEAIRIPNRALLILTGNNMSLAGDLPRRVLICRIDPVTDQPFARQFDLDPLQWVLEHRAEMMAAACILIRARFTHMADAAPGRLASFEAWDNLVRQTVCWADKVLRPGAFGDPMDLVREAQAADPESDALFALLDALRDQFGAGEFTAKGVQAAAKAISFDTPIALALHDLAGDRALASGRSLGRVLKFREGRIVHGLRLTGRQDTNTGARAYRVRAAETENTGITALTGYFPVTQKKWGGGS